MDSQRIMPITGQVGCDVVVIDDFRELTAEIAEALRGRGLSVQIAFDAAAALVLARTVVPAVALVDCTLPDGDGLQLMRELRQRWPETVFLVMSGDVGGISEDTARQLRIHAFFNKPFSIRALAQAIERLVRSHRDRGVRQETPRAWIALGIGSPARRVRSAPPIREVFPRRG